MFSFSLRGHQVLSTLTYISAKHAWRETNKPTKTLTVHIYFKYFQQQYLLLVLKFAVFVHVCVYTCMDVCVHGCVCMCVCTFSIIRTAVMCHGNIFLPSQSSVSVAAPEHGSVLWELSLIRSLSVLSRKDAVQPLMVLCRKELTYGLSRG